MLCTWPPALLSAALALSSPGTESPNSPRLWSSKSPPLTHLSLSKRGSFSSTESALSGLCGQPHPPPNAPSAGASATQPLAARKASPTLNAAGYVAIYRIQLGPTLAFNAKQNQSCRRSWMVSALMLPQCVSIATTTTLQTHPLARSVWKR